MRLIPRVAALCVGLLASHHVAATELPQRWVSAGGALSEWVSALGGESKLVGVDTTSQHPEALKALPSIGYQRQLSAEGILACARKYWSAPKKWGHRRYFRRSARRECKSSCSRLSRICLTLHSNLEHLGKLLGTEDQASKLFPGLSAAAGSTKGSGHQGAAEQPSPGVLVLIGHAGGKPLIAGKDTAADWLIQRAGGHNLRRIPVTNRFPSNP